MPGGPTKAPGRPDRHRHPALLRAAQLLAAGRMREVEQTLRAHLRAHPDDPGAEHMLGAVAAKAGATREAETLFRRAIAHAPLYAEAHLSLAQLLVTADRPAEAIDSLETLLAREPTHRIALSMQAGLLARQRRFAAADALFRRLVAHHPDHGHGWLNYGHLLKAEGRIDAAEAAYRQATTSHDARGMAWWGLANLKSVPLTAADIAAMRTALAAAADDNNRIALHFALAKALHDGGDYQAAFEHLRPGNALRLAGAPHDVAQASATFRITEAIFTPAFFAAHAGTGVDARDPIFIVGMPRSGSTLVEQILASHPLIEGTEELHDFHRIARGMIPPGSPGLVAGVASLPPARLRELGHAYLDATRRYRISERPFFTDKLPSNWLYTGLIHVALPNAKIIDVRRHPMACGFANFAQHYSRGNNYTYDLAAIGHVYVDYVRTMAHFDRVAPGMIHRVHHEALIDDLEGEVRRLLTYLGLPFDAACVRFHETARAVHTPSADQVRRPLNRDGVARWRAYETWLGPLKEALGPLPESYPSVPAGW